MTRREKAINYHNQGFNCCQSVVLTYSDILGVDQNLILKVSEGFGLGISGEYSFCGAMSGVVMISGLLKADGSLVGGTTKHKTYQETKVLIDEFKKRVGSINCYDIKGIESNKPIMSCNDAISIACDIVEEYLIKNV